MTDHTIPSDGGTDRHPRFEIRNLGGISEAELSLSEGVTLVTGGNASNKSSLLRSLAGVLGGPVPPLKSDAEAGAVEMTVDGSSYHLELRRRQGRTVVTDSNTYSSSDSLCELFVALTETNPIRRAVLTGDDLHDLLMEPVDTAAIETEIRRLREEKAELDERLEELDSMEGRLPGLRARLNSLEEKRDEVEAELEAKRDEVEDIERELDEDDEEEAEALREKRAERTETRDELRTHESAIDSLEAELEEVTDQLAEFEGEGPGERLAELETELEELHRQKQQLSSTINTLSPIVEMNAAVLEDEADVPEAMTSSDIVAELDPSTRSITCWTCGSTVERAQIADQVDDVRDIVEDKREEREAVTERIQELTDEKRDLERRREDREELGERRAEIADELDRRRSALADAKTRLRSLESEIEELQRTVTDDEGDGERLSEYYDDIGDLEYERGQLASDVAELESEIETIESALSDRDAVASRRESVEAELEERRERITRIERDLVATFNEEMQRVLDSLGYDAVERIWIERLAESDDPTTETTFDLRVVRTSESGAAYEDALETLSKSEREVVGLIVALSGYLVHDVAREVPFIVVDAVEMFDAARIHGLMDHFSDHADYVVATVLPEDRDALTESYATASVASVTGGS